MKNYREKEIKYLYISYVLLFLYWSTDTFQVLTRNANRIWNDIFTFVDVVAIAGVISLLAFVLDSVISSDIKDKLVGLFFIPRAGETIFSRLLDGKVLDDRFSKQEAKEKYDSIIRELPKDKKEKRAFENAQWYKIYVKYQEKGSVSQAQKDYLLCRDLYVDTIAFGIMYVVAIITFTPKVYFSTNFLFTLLITAALTNIATHKKMNRFVNNVIALDIALSKD